ncbi:hypothetical protein AKJ09_01163 [Labilithrix luteola]|uniref:Uncharacterized protein n=1 Tax=Labilithrix luteola TaxID=1391654 RepID=A0A0K1PN09_9BACT|nr:hypothetical protein [Labilithrix luteola]AKU94499.1 hypothetical protein AKJ09_01163 [Labilithrix luteola]
MNTSQKIAKLEALLVRVQSRAVQSRAPRSESVVNTKATQPVFVPLVAVATPAPPTVSPESEPVAVAPTAPALSEPPNAAATEAFFQTVPPGADYDAEVSEAEVSEAELAEAELAAAAAAEGDVESVDLNADDVEVSAEVVEVDIDVEESGAAAVAMESGAQPVAAAAGPDELEEVEEPAARTSAPPPALGAPTEEVAHVAAANELEEPVPSSSRRPVASDAPEAEEAYEEESAPRHTPPPESGKQVAAPSVSPAPRNSSFPPESLGGHTLIGGWREPGLPGGPPAIGSPVRVPGPGAFAPQATGQSPVAPPQMGPPSTLGAMPGPKPARLSPEVVRPELPAGGRVATVEGTAPAFKPANFGELLDATLAL